MVILSSLFQINCGQIGNWLSGYSVHIAGKNPVCNQSASRLWMYSTACFLKLLTQAVPAESAGLPENKKHASDSWTGSLYINSFTQYRLHIIPREILSFANWDLVKKVLFFGLLGTIQISFFKQVHLTFFSWN